MSDKARKNLRHLRECPGPEYAREILKIRDKAGETVPFVMNEPQRIVEEALEAQKSEFGYVRAMVLKARQEGISTWVGGRYYRRASLRKGTNVYILAHEQSASDNLFDMVERFHKNNPFAPHVGTSNAKELVFDRMDSSYTVATAGQKAGGRSRALSLFHGSEVAFWPNAHLHFAASVQGVPLLPNTEIILESTANGPGGEFYERWQNAEAGLGDYIAIFIPWFAMEDYRRTPPAGFELSNEADADSLSEVEYAEMFGLSLEQMCWRRAKIIELRSEALFRQEYPATPDEAFVSADRDSYISAVKVLRARKRKDVEGAGPLIMGVDPASLGGDRFSIAARRGNKVLWVKHRSKVDPEAGKLWVKSLIDEHNPSRVNIDAGNIGQAIISGLKAMDPDLVNIIRGINFGGKSQFKTAKPRDPGPVNRRAEMWQRSLEWLDLPEGVSIPDEDYLQSDACGPTLKPRLNQDFVLESKQDMKARGVRSPDGWDSVVLTFAFNEFLEEKPKGSSNPTAKSSGHLPGHVVTRTGRRNGWMGR